MRTLPRKLDVALPRDLADMGRRVFDFASDVYEILRLLPVIETKAFQVRDEFPIYVPLKYRPLGVCRIATYETDSPSVRISSPTIDWAPTDSTTDSPGIVINDLPGLSSDTDYTLVLLLISERS